MFSVADNIEASILVITTDPVAAPPPPYLPVVAAPLLPAPPPPPAPNKNISTCFAPTGLVQTPLHN